MLPNPPAPIEILADDGRWRIALERFRLPGADWTLRSHPDWNALMQVIGASPCSFSIVEVTIPAIGVWTRRLAGIQRLGPAHRVAVVGTRHLVTWSSVLAEAGAICGAWSVDECRYMARCIGKYATARPPRERPIREMIFERLPWAVAATEGGALASDGG
jgi:hypothetical protein